MQVTLDAQAILTTILLGGGSMIVYFLAGIHSKFEKVVDKVNEHETRITVAEGEIKEVKQACKELENLIRS